MASSIYSRKICSVAPSEKVIIVRSQIALLYVWQLLRLPQQSEKYKEQEGTLCYILLRKAKFKVILILRDIITWAFSNNIHTILVSCTIIYGRKKIQPWDHIICLSEAKLEHDEILAKFSTKLNSLKLNEQLRRIYHSAKKADWSSWMMLEAKLGGGFEELCQNIL